MAMFGWSRLAEAELYTEAANRKRLAHASAERIEANFAYGPAPGVGENQKNITKSKAKR